MSPTFAIGSNLKSVNLKKRECKLVEKGTGEIMKVARLTTAEMHERNATIENTPFYWQVA